MFLNYRKPKNMKATLLIKNIEILYTCDELFHMYHKSFLAVRHGKIMDFGTHDYKDYIDDATRIIDAQGEIVIPALIDCSFYVDKQLPHFARMRKENETLFYMRNNGILTLLSKDPALQKNDVEQEVLVSRKDYFLDSIATIKEYQRKKPLLFMLSCQQGSIEENIYSLWPIAYDLFNTCGINERELLEAMTSLPAREAGLKDLGSIKNGYQADFLVLRADSIQQVFKTSGISLIHRMIKKGIQIYPNLLRS